MKDETRTSALVPFAREEADAEIEQLRLRTIHGVNWATKYHNKGFVIREKVVETEFEFPVQPKPRDKYFVTSSPKPNWPGSWDSTLVKVFRRSPFAGEGEFVGEYVRNYALLQTFEPFRQGNREMALISLDYTRTAVLDLATGSVIAHETETEPRGGGFCPVGFFVPDWWDVHDGSVLPGGDSWSTDDEWPIGDFGFVWGCVWGDDSSWKVQYLDLRRVQEGVIGRDDRFGYLELATVDYKTPCLSAGAETLDNGAPPEFIRVSKYKGNTNVKFAVEMTLDLETGRSEDWHRLGIKNFD